MADADAVGLDVDEGDGLGEGLGEEEVEGEGEGLEDEPPLKTIVRELLLTSVTSKLLVVSLIVNVSVVAFCDVTVKLA